jgi:primosomal protein N' (replication factor Y)
MACGWVSGCRHCSAHLVVHAVDRSLRCHHCGYREAVPLACPVCGNQDLRPVGRGTQRLESALRARFARARILRVDRDSVRSAAQWNAALAAIRDHSAELIVGTQILAKGHDFPKLTLVGVINADASLFAADFRAPERLFAQLMQVAGRSGRADLPGEVLVQTDFPDHPLFASLVAHDYEGFARAQLADRQAAGFPPFRHQALLRAEATSLAETLAFLSRARAVAEPLRGEQIDLYDPVPMRLTRRAGQERAQLLIESAQRSALQAFLDEWLAALHGSKGGRDLRWHIDIDPLDL